LAYPLIQREKPDIIITDIRMPFMDGLELSQLIRNELPESKIIILSGHEEFSYAQKALKLGIAEYILKPVSGAELVASVKSVAERIKREREEKHYTRDESNGKSRLFEAIISGALPIAKILDRGRQLNIELSARFFQIILFKYYFNTSAGPGYAEDILALNERINQISAKAGNVILFDRLLDGTAAIIKEDSFERLAAARQAYINSIESVFSEYETLRYFGGIGKPVERLTLLPESFENAARAFSARFVSDRNAFIDDSEIDFMGKQGGVYPSADAPRTQENEPIEQRNNHYHLMIQRAKEYIAAHYADEDISLSDVARFVNISPSYFSALFSRETGQSLIRCLTEYRVNKAKELLRSSDMSASEIGAAVGYKDPHYFSYIFKKTQNCSPMQYRASQKHM
jgi:two-component system response regulator YesN